MSETLEGVATNLYFDRNFDINAAKGNCNDFRPACLDGFCHNLVRGEFACSNQKAGAEFFV